MKKLFTLSIIICIAAATLKGQAVSSLVKLDENGKLEYFPFANIGETNEVNIIPDFSFAGYKYGGVEIPEAPVVLTLSPLAGDNYQQIQDAIDAVSAMPLNEDGFRGAILFEPGIYQVDEPLNINTSGVVLRGSGQFPGDEGGTELVANARYQHNFITFRGELSAAVTGLLIDTIVIPQAIIPNEDDGDFWLDANITEAAEIKFASNKIMSFHLTADGVDDYASYRSKEFSDPDLHPYVELTLHLTQQQKDTVIFLPPTDDTFVRAGSFANDNYGDAVTLPIKNRGATSDVTREIFLRFEMPDLAAQVVNAKLYLYCNNAPNDSDMLNFVTLIANDNWSEHEVTFNNRPTQIASQRITTPYVPSGGNTFMVESAEEFEVGDKIIVLRTPNEAWIDLLNMAQFGWTPEGYHVAYERTITDISGNQITIDVPLVQSIVGTYGGGGIFPNPAVEKSNHGGVENMYISSYYASETDEEHGWVAISFRNFEDSWVRNVTGRYFGYGLVNISNGFRITIEDSAFLDPKSITTGGRKYSFNIASGSFNLFQRLYTRGGRHDYATGSRVEGPNVFVDCVAEETYSDIGPHHRYATGTLFDNIQGGQMRVWNRGASGTGHGWAGAQTMFWNCHAPNHEIRVDSPPNAMNWGVGCIGGQRTGAGFWEKWSMHVLPRSLYYQQLQDRLGEDAVMNTTIPAQHSGRIYDVIKNWKGYGPLTEFLPSNNPRLADLRIDDETVSNFHPNTLDYTIEMTRTAVPEITAIPYFTTSVIDISSPDTLPGTFTIEVTAEDGESQRIYNVNFVESTTTVNELDDNEFSVYPNPAGNFIHISYSGYSSNLNVRVFNLTGQQMLEQRFSGNDLSFDISSLSPGVYLISLENETDGKRIKRFVKR